MISGKIAATSDADFPKSQRSCAEEAEFDLLWREVFADLVGH
jgi:hypothetical protein